MTKTGPNLLICALGVHVFFYLIWPLTLKFNLVIQLKHWFTCRKLTKSVTLHSGILLRELIGCHIRTNLALFSGKSQICNIHRQLQDKQACVFCCFCLFIGQRSKNYGTNWLFMLFCLISLQSKLWKWLVRRTTQLIRFGCPQENQPGFGRSDDR